MRCKVADHHRQVFRTRDKLPSAVGAAADCLVDANPAAPLETEETRERVLRVLEEMPDRQRTVLEWKYLDSLRVREMAERLGETEKAVETVLYRARIEFRRLFEQERFRGREGDTSAGDGVRHFTRVDVGRSWLRIMNNLTTGTKPNWRGC